MPALKVNFTRNFFIDSMLNQMYKVTQDFPELHVCLFIVLNCLPYPQCRLV